MADHTQYQKLWGWCEYFLAHAESGVNLICFDLIKETYQGKATSDAYICERLTRPTLAKSAKGIKRFVQDHVARDRLGQLEGTAKSLGETLKSNLLEDTVHHLDAALVNTFLRNLRKESSPEALLLLGVIYYTYYKNKKTTGMGLPPWFIQLFYALVVKSQKADTHKLEDWQNALAGLFSTLWKANGRPGEKLAAFFDHEVTAKIVAYCLAGAISFTREQEDKARYLFEVTNRLSSQDYKYFQTFCANGLNAVLKRNKRAIQEPESVTCQSIQIGVISREQIKTIVDNAVDKHFDPALDLCVQYHISLAQEQPRRKLAKLFDKTFLTMNRDIWKELLTLADVQRRVVFRTRHLLRVVVFYLFEIRGIERQFYLKYIASVDRIIHFAFEDNPKRMKRFETHLGRQLSLYRNAGEYNATDWEGFYNDVESREIALKIIRGTAQKARSKMDSTLPSVWFSNLVEKGVDDQVLFRFFRQGSAPA